MGLRSLYFVLAGAVGRFRYLKPSLAAILGFVAIKMLVSEVMERGIAVSLSVVAGILLAGILASWLRASPGSPADADESPA
jgi:tellurite resistance protein TerC